MTAVQEPRPPGNSERTGHATGLRHPDFGEKEPIGWKDTAGAEHAGRGSAHWCRVTFASCPFGPPSAAVDVATKAVRGPTALPAICCLGPDPERVSGGSVEFGSIAAEVLGFRGQFPSSSFGCSGSPSYFSKDGNYDWYSIPAHSAFLEFNRRAGDGRADGFCIRASYGCRRVFRFSIKDPYGCACGPGSVTGGGSAREAD